MTHISDDTAGERVNILQELQTRFLGPLETNLNTKHPGQSAKLIGVYTGLLRYWLSFSREQVSVSPTDGNYTVVYFIRHVTIVIIQALQVSNSYHMTILVITQK